MEHNLKRAGTCVSFLDTFKEYRLVKGADEYLSSQVIPRWLMGSWKSLSPDVPLNLKTQNSQDEAVSGSSTRREAQCLCDLVLLAACLYCCRIYLWKPQCIAWGLYASCLKSMEQLAQLFFQGLLLLAGRLSANEGLWGEKKKGEGRERRGGK